MYEAVHHYESGIFQGVKRLADNAFIPESPGNRDWEEFLVWNSTAQPPVSTADLPAPVKKRKRSLYDIYADLNLLTGTQKTATWADISSGTPKKYVLDQGPNAAAIAAIDWAATESGATGTSANNARMRLIAMYVQDVPAYLVNPPFDPTINIPGDEVIS